ncbi:MAG: PLP-dependent aspartate aminotransferase family protein [Bacteroidota bacterium]|nr:PLP-dependent aspartate aminotransferase family protein [Bacteroidota bacterium]
MDLSFILNELGEDRDLYFNAISPPIIQTSNFAVNSVDELRKLFKDEYSGYLYSRGLNPTVDIVRQKLAALDGAEDCLVFNSGAAAIFCAVLPFVNSGDHIISVRHPYTWAQRMFDVFLPRFDIHTTYVDGRDPQNFQLALQSNTKIIYLESPNSWYFELQDLRAVSTIAKQHNIVTIVDNSYCTPIYQKPIALGIDLVLQSATKYLAGHSDVIAGVLTGSKNHMNKIFSLEYLLAGNGIQPFNAWLLLRGLRTLPIRLEKISKTTNTIVDYLNQHKVVKKVFFPFDPAFNQYDLAKQQMLGACGLVSVIVHATGGQQIETFCQSLKRFKLAVSWGGHESLVIPKLAGIELQTYDPNNEEHNMLRFYIGLEESDYLMQDLENALHIFK